jgi:hypothetical protein
LLPFPVFKNTLILKFISRLVKIPSGVSVGPQKDFKILVRQPFEFSSRKTAQKHFFICF